MKCENCGRILQPAATDDPCVEAKAECPCGNVEMVFYSMEQLDEIEAKLLADLDSQPGPQVAFRMSGLQVLLLSIFIQMFSEETGGLSPILQNAKAKLMSQLSSSISDQTWERLREEAGRLERAVGLESDNEEGDDPAYKWPDVVH